MSVTQPGPVMTAMRIVLVMLFVGLLSATVFGFLAQRSLDDSDGFAASMSTAMQDPRVESEVQSSVKTTVFDAVTEFGENADLISSLIAGLSAESLADAAARAVNTPDFEEAWAEWALLLHQGLADFARGQPNSDIQVDGQYLEMRIGPLVTPLLGTGPAAELTGPVESLIGDRSVVVDTGEDMESRLRALGVFAGARWLLAVGAALALALAVFIGPRQTRWLAISLAAAGLGLMLFAVALASGDSAISNGTTPALNESIRSTLTNDWTVLVGVWAAMLLAAALGLVLISREDSPDSPPDPNPI